MAGGAGAAGGVGLTGPTGRAAWRGVRAAYEASKARVVLVTKAVALRHGWRGIRSNAVAPGLVLTPALANHYGSADELGASQRLYPMPRLCKPEDVASAVVFSHRTMRPTSTAPRRWSRAGDGLHAECPVPTCLGATAWLLACESFVRATDRMRAS